MASTAAGAMVLAVAVAPAAAAPKPSKDPCKHGTFQTMHRSDGSEFRNPGDCTRYVNQGGSFLEDLGMAS